MNTQTSGNSTRRSFVISVVGGLTLLLLAVTVFAVSSQARLVSSQAEQAVQITENLRVVSVARAELSIATGTGTLGPGQTEAVSGSIESANDALDAVEQNFDELTSSAIRREFAAYREAADRQSALILSGSSSHQQATAAEAATGEAFVRLAGELREEQLAAVEGLRADNDLMNLISTIATFVVAFVVPSAALYIFESLRRTPRRARQMEQAYEKSAATASAMAAALAAEADGLRQIVNGLPVDRYTTALHRSVSRLDHLAALNGSVRSRRNEAVDLGELAAAVAQSIGHRIEVKSDDASDAVAITDHALVSLMLVELLENAVTHGSAPVRVEIGSEGPLAFITVTDHGDGLPSAVENAVVHDNDYALRSNLVSGAYGLGLLSAREAAVSLGGQLRYHRHDDRTSLIIELPRNASAQVQLPEFSPPPARESLPVRQTNGVASQARVTQPVVSQST